MSQTASQTSPTAGVPPLRKEGWQSLVFILNQYYTNDLRKVADKFQINETGSRSKAHTIERLANLAHNAPEKLKELMDAIAPLPQMRKRPQAAITKRLNVETAVSAPVADIPQQLPQVECVCMKTDMNAAPLTWCPHCKRLQHKVCIFGNPPGINLERSNDSWNTSAAYLKYINATSYNEFTYGEGLNPWDDTRRLVMKNHYKRVPLIHDWHNVHIHPDDKGDDKGNRAKSGYLPMPMVSRSRLNTMQSLPLACTVACCVRCSLCFMDPFRMAAGLNVVPNEVPAVLGPGVSGLEGLADSFESSIQFPSDIVDQSKWIADYMMKKIPLVKSLFGSGEKFIDSYSKAGEGHTSSRSSVLWEFRIPESYPRDNRLFISANIQGARFSLPLSWRELRRKGYICELRGILIKDAGPRRYGQVKWPHEMQLNLKGQRINIQAPDPNSSRRDMPMDISSYVHGGDNQIELKMQIGTELAPNSSTRVSRAFGLAVVLCRRIEPMVVARSIIARNLMEMTVNANLMKKLRSSNEKTELSANAPESEFSDEIRLRSLINASTYHWFSRLASITSLKRNSANQGAEWLDSMNYLKEGGGYSKAESDDDDEIKMVDEKLDLCIKTTDCISMEPITCPIRGRFCRHPQTLDLLAFLQVVSRMYPRFNRYNCPLCESEIQFCDVIIDWELWLSLNESKDISSAESLFPVLNNEAQTIVFTSEDSKKVIEEGQDSAEELLDSKFPPTIIKQAPTDGILLTETNQPVEYSDDVPAGTECEKMQIVNLSDD
eukprot:GHVH01013526.1.p1 GENE.GHVH01013526.1~~GHVH01013526.1.p1  ORF type:complete len:775 (+),score=88.38 GHVH01013526.1:991-3315(+)